MISAAKRKKTLEHVGRTFKDNEDGQTYQVQRVVKSKADRKTPPTAFYELANINEHSNSRRMNRMILNTNRVTNSSFSSEMVSTYTGEMSTSGCRH